MTDIRKALVTKMIATETDEQVHQTWTYEEVRPMPVPPTWKPGQKVRGDCAKGVQYLCKWSGAPDPMNNNWGVWGNSTTICEELDHRTALQQMQPGDPVTFGPGGDEHATIVKELIKDSHGNVTDLMMWSFGHQGAPNYYKLTQDGREYQLLRMPIPNEHVPITPADLRARTGYWAWRQWRLGKGTWRKYGKHNKHVRPDVPRLIPLEWWKRLAKQKARAKKGNKPTTPLKP